MEQGPDEADQYDAGRRSQSAPSPNIGHLPVTSNIDPGHGVSSRVLRGAASISRRK